MKFVHIADLHLDTSFTELSAKGNFGRIRRLDQREVNLAFVVLDPRQEKDYDRGLCYFLENIPVKQIYPMHYWGNPEIIRTFLKDHPEYKSQIQLTE